MTLKRILFVTHALESLYGASTSLRLLLRNYASIEADLVVPRSLRHPRDLVATAAPYAAVRNVYELSLPIDFDLVGIKRGGLGRTHDLINRAYWQFDRSRFRDLVKRQSYDFIHLNSPVLHKVIDPGMPTIAHIRDIILDAQSPVIDKLAMGSGLVFIDMTTRRPFERVLDRVPSTVLNNPIDMSDISEYSGLSHPKLTPSTTVFSIIGRVSEIKGVEFVIQAFKDGAHDNSLLLIVGDGSPSYVARCKAAAGGDSRIVFWGEESDIKKIYASTHHVVRGDPHGCIGRTVYEGLYSGCDVIMPGLGEPNFIFDPERFEDRILLYRSRDVGSLSALFASRSTRGPQKRIGTSNVGEHVSSFDSFLDQCLENRRSAAVQRQ